MRQPQSGISAISEKDPSAILHAIMEGMNWSVLQGNVINLDGKQAYIPILVHNYLEKAGEKTWTDALFSSVFRGYVTLKLMGNRAENLK